MRLSVDEIVAIHDRLIDQIGGSGGIRDRRLLESAVEAPFASFDEQHFYPTVTAQSARLGFGLIANHPFIDGNKRVGVVSMIVMLRGNGIEFAPTNDDLVALGFAIAQHHLTVDDVIEWINQRI